MTSVIPIKAFQDNYIWLLQDQPDLPVVIVDPGDATPVQQYLQQNGLDLGAILCTHHHWDHTGGVQQLRDQYDIPVYGPAAENISVVTHPLKDGDTVNIDALPFSLAVTATHGHTSGHIVYYGNGLLFCGDTLFSAGCGRLFEGTAKQMFASLTKLKTLPADTMVYCGHEYTLSNLSFAETVEPNNNDIQQYIDQADQKLSKGAPTLPSSIALERKVNPFLRANIAEVKQSAEQHEEKTLSSDLEVFTVLRRWKDNFRG